jgi:hypothetical protein
MENARYYSVQNLLSFHLLSNIRLSLYTGAKLGLSHYGKNID